MTDNSIEQSVKELMVERLFLQVKAEDIGDDQPIMETLGVDSVSVFEIVVGLEEKYGISFADDEFKIEQFRTPRTIAEFVRGKLGGS